MIWIGIIEEHRGIKVERNRAWRIESILGMASKSMCKLLSAYTFAICKNKKLVPKPQMIEGITNMILCRTIKNIMLILL